MTFKVKITPKTEKVLITIPKLIYMHKKSIRNSLNEIGKDVVRTTVKLIKSPPKTGKIYPFRGGTHQASAPHEAPAEATGTLSKSARYATRSHVQMEIGEDAEYASFLEKGTKRMAPRPVLLKAVNDNARNAVRILETNMQRNLK